ncbi:MAG: MBL fold metallo-hydrolase, partial [Candidatus Omnitrophica bacterium]|nr:MBL fold metallo-hydrolase [Candidatus Omnitrophota bacterium]
LPISGIWIKYKDTNILIDPGPGSLVNILKNRERLNPEELNAVILTHKHLDHSGDVNVMVEAMTRGGHAKKGALIAPRDAFGADGVIYKYLCQYPKEIVILKKGKFSVGDIKFDVVTRNLHGAETYGLKMDFGGKIVSFVGDTKYFRELAGFYRGTDILVLNVVFTKKRKEYDHLSIDEALELVKEIKPKRAIFTHFGMNFINQEFNLRDKEYTSSTGVKVKCAYDGMNIDL